MKNNENGRSMVEMLGVLAIIGVLSAGGLAGYSKAMFKHKLNTTMDQITMLVTNIRTMYGTQGNYEGLTNTEASSLGVVPAVMGNGATLTNPFKGNVNIVATGTNNESFTVAFDGLPTEACIALATADFGSGAGSGFVGVIADKTGTAAASADGSSIVIGTGIENKRAEGKAYEMADAVSDCAGAKNTIIWKFY